MENRIRILWILIALPVWVSGQASFDKKIVDIGNIGLTVTNVGTLGYPDVRNDPDGGPSMEYPLNSGIEHLFEAGIWIGAQVDGQTAVSTASVDAPTGYSTGAAGFEFTAAVGNTIQERSSFTASDFFSFNAISHQDLLVDFSDKNAIIPGTNIEITDHNIPLNADVHLETYAWNFSFADYFVILNYTITNNSTTAWDSVYLGLWTDLVVRNINVATDAGAAFFSKSGGGYIDSMTALYAFDVLGEPDFTSSYGASQFLGIEWRGLFFHPSNKDTFVKSGLPVPKVNANFWRFRDSQDPDFPAPENELGRYEKLKTGLDFNNQGISDDVREPNNRVQLMSAGPLVEVAAGETVNFVLALVCAKQLSGTSGCPKGTSGNPGADLDTDCAREELNNNLGWARRTFNGEDLNGNGLLDEGEDLDDDGELDRYILPEPPATPKIKIIPSSGKVEIYWDNLAEASIDPISKKQDFEGYRLYRSQIGEDLNLDLINSADIIAQWDKQGNAVGFNNGFDQIRLSNPAFFSGDTVAYYYKYELDALLNGWQYVFIITSFDEGDQELRIESLESSFVENAYGVYTGTVPHNFEDGKDTVTVGVYPNPYRVNATWDGTTARTRKLYFYNLPELCDITIYTLSGDVVALLNHDASTYDGTDTQWFDNFGGDASKRIFSGGEHAWDILSETGQDITQGLYIFTVKDINSNKVQQGKFAVIK